MYEFNIFESSPGFVPVSESIKPKRCKWSYEGKKCLWEGRNLYQTLKMVTKMIHSERMTDYEETFSLVVMLKFICILMSSCAL